MPRRTHKKIVIAGAAGALLATLAPPASVAGADFDRPVFSLTVVAGGRGDGQLFGGLHE